MFDFRSLNYFISACDCITVFFLLKGGNYFKYLDYAKWGSIYRQECFRFGMFDTNSYALKKISNFLKFHFTTENTRTRTNEPPSIPPLSTRTALLRLPLRLKVSLLISLM